MGLLRAAEDDRRERNALNSSYFFLSQYSRNSFTVSGAWPE
jgi:hypothetical protein